MQGEAAESHRDHRIHKGKGRKPCVQMSAEHSRRCWKAGECLRKALRLEGGKCPVPESPTAPLPCLCPAGIAEASHLGLLASGPAAALITDTWECPMLFFKKATAEISSSVTTSSRPGREEDKASSVAISASPSILKPPTRHTAGAWVSGACDTEGVT